MENQSLSDRKRRELLRALLGAGLAVCFRPARADIPTVEARHLFDITGQGAGGLSLPSDVAIGREGRAYVVDGGNQRVVAFDRSGRYLFATGRMGSGEGQFKDPVGIGADGSGRIYVADRGNHRIQAFDAEGRFQYAFPVVSGGKPVHPIDIAPDSSGTKLYVTGNDKVMEFDARGKPLREWGGHGEGAGEFRYPATIAVTPQGAVYVVDALNARVQVFDANGKLRVQVGSWGVLPGQFYRPKGVALDQRGRIYVSDSYLDVVEVFSEESRFLHVLGRAGAPQRFTSVGGIAIDTDNRLFAAEMLRHKVSVYALSA
jgi:DNA-binding beta-propeller fold protein YncE